MRAIRFLTVAVVLIAASGILSAKNLWMSGRVISTGLNGYGNPGNARTGNARTEDIWWSYCISSENQTYSVLSRINPERAGLKENSSIRFMEKQNQIYVMNPGGKRISLKIIRKGIANKCP